MIAYFDCISGASGDMLLGALLDAGLCLEGLQEQLDRLNLPGLRLRADMVKKNGFGATKMEVVVEDSHRHRNFSEIQKMIDSSPLSNTVKERSIKVFHRLAEAEAHIHRTSLGRVHFHEVGALDAIADIVGAVAGLELLGVTRVEASPLPLGTGFVQSAHGKQPIPAPATLALVRNVPVRGTEVEAELVTPTGAALLTTLSDCFGPMPPMYPKAVGYGAGTQDLEWPNVLRVILGEPVKALSGGGAIERLALIEANIDDMNPEFYEHISDVLFSRGALDVYWTPVGMKKSRPGILLSILCRPEAREHLVESVLRETTSLGVRWTWTERVSIQRHEIKVETQYGPIQVRVAPSDSSEAAISPEYEDCRRVARDQKIPLWRIYEEVLVKARETLGRAD